MIDVLQVGMPRVGKSTVFSLLKKYGIPPEISPGPNMEPNIARVNVPDKRFDWLCEHYKPEK